MNDISEDTRIHAMDYQIDETLEAQKGDIEAYRRISLILLFWDMLCERSAALSMPDYNKMIDLRLYVQSLRRVQ